MDERQSKQVEKLFLDSGASAGYQLADNFLLQEGEVFYEDGKIVEVRLAGTLSQLISKRKKHQESWCFTGKPPGFELTSDFGIALSAQDRDRAHIAVMRLGNFFIFSWDIALNMLRRIVDSPDISNIDKRLIRIVVSGRQSKVANAQSRELYDIAIRHAVSIAEAAYDMRRLFVRLRDGEATGTSGDDQSFRHAFTPLLKQMADVGISKREGQGRLSLTLMSEHDMKKELLKAVLGSAKERLSIGRGRPPGSKTKKRNLNPKKIELERKKKERLKKKILCAIMAEYKKFLRNWPPIEAEFKVKVSVVVTRLNAPRSTFYSWLKKLGCNFKELKTEAIKCTGN